MPFRSDGCALSSRRPFAGAAAQVGGFECYLAADDEQEGTGAADVYRANDTENDLLSVRRESTTCRNWQM